MTGDSYLGLPIFHTYVAEPLQQQSIILESGFSNTLTFSGDTSIRGQWKFKVLGCEYYALASNYVCNNNDQGQLITIDVKVVNTRPYFKNWEELESVEYIQNSGI